MTPLPESELAAMPGRTAEEVLMESETMTEPNENKVREEKDVGVVRFEEG